MFGNEKAHFVKYLSHLFFNYPYNGLKCQRIYMSRFYMLTVQSVIQRPQATVYVNQDSNILATL